MRGGIAVTAITLAALPGCELAFPPPPASVDADTCDRSGFDEDGDQIDDACDNCPGVANAQQTDAGEVATGLAADGIGDACDPHPARAGDRIAQRELFGDAPRTWSGSGWFAGDGYVQASADADTLVLHGPSSSAESVTVEAAIELVALQEGFEIGLALDGAVGDACVVRDDAAPETSLVELRLFPSGLTSDELTLSPELAAGDRVVVQAERTLGLEAPLMCRAIGTPGAAVSPLSSGTTGERSIYALRVGARVRHIVVYEAD
jgi:hypothetical protein